MIANVLWSLLGIVAGSFIAIQGPVNAQLARGLGVPVAAAAASFLSGAVLLFLVTVVYANAQGLSLNWRGPPAWTFLAGGALGGIYVTSAVFLVPRIGAAATMAFAVTGQLAAGMILDRLGVLGLAVREISLGPGRGRGSAGRRSLADPADVMRVDLFDFDLPESSIALRPASPRDAARLLVTRPDEPLQDRVVADLPSLLCAGDALVFNDTKVIPAQLCGRRHRGEASATVDATLHMRVAPDRWVAFVRPAKRIAAGDRVAFGHGGTSCLSGSLDATVVEKREAGEVLFAFELAGAALDEALHAVGHIPLPPYIASKRPEDERDRLDYQTIYARDEGAVAAPTAGLHFTPDLFAALDRAGIERHFVTLHVGAGTFLPVKANDTTDHHMHAETGTITMETADALNRVRRRGRRVVPVGTTSLRLLESAAAADGTLSAWSGSTDIFITPGYDFRVVDALMTNFHLPRSTLFMLVSAFAGLDTMRAAYAHAIASDYRFYSYGDASLLFRRAEARSQDQ